MGALAAFLVWGSLFGVAVWLNLRIARKAGYADMYGWLASLPLLNLASWIFFSRSEWPIERRLRELETEVARLSAPPMAGSDEPPPEPASRPTDEAGARREATRLWGAGARVKVDGVGGCCVGVAKRGVHVAEILDERGRGATWEEAFQDATDRSHGRWPDWVSHPPTAT